MTIVLICMIFLLFLFIVFLVFTIKNKISENIKLRIKNAELISFINISNQKENEKAKQFNVLLEEKFENISNRILKNQNEDFRKNQMHDLSVVLNPFKQDLCDFKSLLEKTNAENKEDKGFLKKHLEDLENKSLILSKNANDLVNALKGNSKVQGDWGENQLKNILDMSGYIEGQDYQMQFNLKNDDNENYRPDCIIMLPDGKKLIIDSKVSISNYIDYMKSEDEKQKKHYLDFHISSIKKHITELSNKEYQKLLKDNGLDFVFMFIPNEAAYIEALKYDNTIYSNAYKSNVAIVTPSSVLPILRTVKNLWNIEKQNHNASMIALKAGELYNKFVGFINNMELINKNIINAKNAYDNAYKQLYSGKGNAMSIAEKMKELGANTSKQISVEFDKNDD